MKLIIDIDERAYKGSLQLKTDDDMGFLAGHLINAVANGTPLPKGHGAIIDVKDIDRIHISDNGEVMIYKLGTDVKALVHAHPLAEADEENKNETDN